MSGIVRGIRQAGGVAVSETMHRVHVAVVDACGALIASSGEASWLTPLRSCAKPFQALALFTSGAVDRWHITDQELALACSSHEAEPLQVEIVSAWLARLGLSEADLQCGEHAPLSPTSARYPRPLHNNCSGKHTGMLAAALTLGAPPRDYLRLPGPVQQLCRVALAACAGLEPAAIPFAVDGCSAPTAVLTLQQLARAAASLAVPDAVPAHSDALRRIAAVMMVHADLVGGTHVLDTLLMRSIRGLVAKRGADGVYLLAVDHSRFGPVGVALKVEDGSNDARGAAVLALLDVLELLVPAARTALSARIRPARKNHRGLVIGHYEVDLQLATHTPSDR